MKQRTDVWKDKAYPFGSEMAWDSTGGGNVKIEGELIK